MVGVHKAVLEKNDYAVMTCDFSEYIGMTHEGNYIIIIYI
jgi:hypothetical protein